MLRHALGTRALARRLTLSSINPGIIKAEYAIEGPICIRADEMAAEMKRGVKFPFPELIRCNIGNPFELGKKELTFPRQLIAATECKEVRNSRLFPDEVIARANEFLANISGGLGAYSSGEGHEFVRNNVAQFITRRDGYASDPFNVLLTNGASHAMKRTVDLFTNGRNSGIIVPLPTYPVYTAEISMRNGTIVPCYLDEAHGWRLTVDELDRAYTEAVRSGVDVKMVVMINPSNPTGSVMTYDELAKVVKFCEEKGIVLLADEVYQANTYTKERPFVSMRKVACDMKSPVQMVSVHSVSKGFLGECGHRGGYMELHNIDRKIVEQAHKMATIDQCSSTTGQLLLDLQCRPPVSQECRSVWDREVGEELASLKAKAKLVVDTLNGLPGISCQPAAGAMYVFPTLNLPKKAIEASNHMRVYGEPVDPDMFWCWKLLETTGIVVVPGSGFGQVPGSYHFRIAFLPEAGKMGRLIERLTKFQHEFMNEFQ